MTYSYGPLHMAVQKHGGQLEPTYSSSVRLRSVALGTCRKGMNDREGWLERVKDICTDAQQDEDKLMSNQKPCIHLFSLAIGKIVGQTVLFSLSLATHLGEEKL